MEVTFIDLAHFFVGLYSLILILVGTPLNLLCFYIYIRLVPNRTNPTIIVFAHLALIELLIPFTWNLNYVVRELLWKYQKNNSLRNLEEHSLFICKLISYSAYFSLQCAAWLKTLATFARCVSVHHEWAIRKWLSKPAIIRRVIWFVIFVVALINFPVCIINGRKDTIRDELNRTKLGIKCYTSTFFQSWEYVHLLLYNFIPFTLMIVCNIFIIRHVQGSRRRTQRSRLSSGNSNTRRPTGQEGGRLTKTLILITVFFIVFTAPAAIFYITLGKWIKTHRALISMCLSNLATTSHVTSFIIYWIISGDFRDAAISILFCRPAAAAAAAATTRRKTTGTTDDKQQEKSASNRSSKEENERKLPLVSATIE